MRETGRELSNGCQLIELEQVQFEHGTCLSLLIDANARLAQLLDQARELMQRVTDLVIAKRAAQLDRLAFAEVAHCPYHG
jgi:hypothetical protein